MSSPLEYGSCLADDCSLYKSYSPALDSSSPGWMAVLADHGTASLSNEKWEDSLSDDFGEQWATPTTEASGYWASSSHLWAALGDSNKRFFYASIHARRAHHTIRCLRDGGYHTSSFWYEKHHGDILLSVGDWPWDQFLILTFFLKKKYWLPRPALGSLERSLFRRWRALWKKLWYNF